MSFSLSHLKVFLVHPVKGVKLLWQKGCFTQDSESLFWSLWFRTRTLISDYFTGYRAGKSVPLLRDKEKPDGSSVPVLNSGLCNMKCLGVSLPFVDGI